MWMRIVHDRCNFLPGSAASVNLQATLCAIIHRWFSFPDTSFFIFLAQSTYSDTFDYLCNLHASPAHIRVLRMCACIYSEIEYILLMHSLSQCLKCYFFRLHVNNIQSQVIKSLNSHSYFLLYNWALTILFSCPHTGRNVDLSEMTLRSTIQMY